MFICYGQHLLTSLAQRRASWNELQTYPVRAQSGNCLGRFQIRPLSRVPLTVSYWAQSSTYIHRTNHTDRCGTRSFEKSIYPGDGWVSKESHSATDTPFNAYLFSQVWDLKVLHHRLIPVSEGASEFHQLVSTAIQIYQRLCLWERRRGEYMSSKSFRRGDGRGWGFLASGRLQIITSVTLINKLCKL